MLKVGKDEASNKNNWFGKSENPGTKLIKEKRKNWIIEFT